MIEMKANFDDVRALLAGLSQASQEEVTRPAAQAGAQVFVDEVRARVNGIGRVTGNLRDSIYQVYSKDNSFGGRAEYHISWNYKTAPHGHLVEYGHVMRYKTYVGRDGNWYTDKRFPLPVPKHVPAKPFLRPAYDAAKDRAATAMKVRFMDEFERVIA